MISANPSKNPHKVRHNKIVFGDLVGMDLDSLPRS